jgi:hypothetical protein
MSVVNFGLLKKGWHGAISWLRQFNRKEEKGIYSLNVFHKLKLLFNGSEPEHDMSPEEKKPTTSKEIEPLDKIMKDAHNRFSKWRADFIHRPPSSKPASPQKAANERELRLSAVALAMSFF